MTNSYDDREYEKYYGKPWPLCPVCHHPLEIDTINYVLSIIWYTCPICSEEGDTSYYMAFMSSEEKEETS